MSPKAFDEVTHKFVSQRVKHVCEFCGEEYERIASKLGKFCSYACSNKALAPQIAQRRTGVFRTRQKLECKQCRRVFYSPLCRIDGRVGSNGQVQKRQYCSNKCRTLASRKPDELKKNKVRLAKWRKAILRRDNYQCVLCGENQTSFLQACHIKSRDAFPDLQYDLNNGRTLCIYCHSEESPLQLKPLILGHIKIGKDIVFSLCAYCGSSYYRKPSQRGIYCGQLCYHKAQVSKPTWNKGLGKKEVNYVSS